MNFDRVEEEGLRNMQERKCRRSGEKLQTTPKLIPMGLINPYMAAKFLPNSLSFSHSPNCLMPSPSEQADPELNERMCHVKTGYYAGTQPCRRPIQATLTSPEEEHPWMSDLCETPLL